MADTQNPNVDETVKEPVEGEDPKPEGEGEPKPEE